MRTVAQKLGFAPESEVVLLDAPDEAASWLDPLPPGVALTESLVEATRPLDLVLLFAWEVVHLAARLTEVAPDLDAEGALWIAYRKKAHAPDPGFGFEAVQGQGLAARLVDNKRVAVSEAWTALRFVVPRANRAACSHE